MSMIMYLVLTPNKFEGVAFESESDARYAATGRRGGGFGVSTIAEAFREAYEECETFDMVQIEVPDRATGAKP